MFDNDPVMDINNITIGYKQYHGTRSGKISKICSEAPEKIDHKDNGHFILLDGKQLFLSDLFHKINDYIIFFKLLLIIYSLLFPLTITQFVRY